MICALQHNVAATNPHLLEDGLKLTSFDPSPLALHPDDFVLAKTAPVLGNLLLDAAGYCTGLCRVCDHA